MGALSGVGPLAFGALTIALLIVVFFGPGTRVGEAVNPGPGIDDSQISCAEDDGLSDASGPGVRRLLLETVPMRCPPSVT